MCISLVKKIRIVYIEIFICIVFILLSLFSEYYERNKSYSILMRYCCPRSSFVFLYGFRHYNVQHPKQICFQENFGNLQVIASPYVIFGVIVRYLLGNDKLSFFYQTDFLELLQKYKENMYLPISIVCRIEINVI